MVATNLEIIVSEDTDTVRVFEDGFCKTSMEPTPGKPYWTVWRNYLEEGKEREEICKVAGDWHQGVGILIGELVPGRGLIHGERWAGEPLAK